MMNDFDNYICEENLSIAWIKAFLKVMNTNEVSPLIVSITGFENGTPIELNEIRRLLDNNLVINKTNLNVNQVANTIFPVSIWNKAKPRQLLYDRYFRIYPKIKKDRRNCYGVYFSRMTAYLPKGSSGKPINQLEDIIKLWTETKRNQNKNPRRTALQINIYDPTRDLTSQPRRGFPCLQHVTFAPFGRDGLVVTGFYALQHIYERAYGNYLGLCRLGHFVAHAMGLKLVRMNCFSGIANLGKIPKSALSVLKKQLLEKYTKNI
ncbi:MAG: thymidylate synthase [Candidatus Lokiarchaeota archaeon]|nr:thymidylate synthase [Candidatus Lokiarchaeota archaeon]